MQTLIHVAVELVLMGGLAFWVQKKTSILQEENVELRDKISKYETILENYGKALAKHEQILQSLTGRSNFDFMRNQMPRQVPQQIPNTPREILKPSQKKIPREEELQEEEEELQEEEEELQEEDFPEEELDVLIDNELKDLRKEPEFIEIECREDICHINKPKKQGLKKRRGKKIKKGEGKTKKIKQKNGKKYPQDCIQ